MILLSIYIKLCKGNLFCWFLKGICLKFVKYFGVNRELILVIIDFFIDVVNCEDLF